MGSGRWRCVAALGCRRKTPVSGTLRCIPVRPAIRLPGLAGEVSILHEPLRVGSTLGNAELRLIVARDGGIVRVNCALRSFHLIRSALMA